MIGTRSYLIVRAASGRTSRTWRLKKLLAALAVLGIAGSFTAASTYAVFNSETGNRGSSAASGTLTFSDTVNTGTACFSYGGPSTPGNVNAACGALVTSATLNYPGQPQTPRVTIATNGSLDASALSLYMPSCTVSATPSAPTPGGADPCQPGGMELYVQETTAAGTATQCWYPTTGTTCAFAPDTLFLFAVNHSTTATAVDLGAGPAHGQSRYFTIGMQLPADATNALQGEAASFPLTWHATS